MRNINYWALSVDSHCGAARQPSIANFQTKEEVVQMVKANNMKYLRGCWSNLQNSPATYTCCAAGCPVIWRVAQRPRLDGEMCLQLQQPQGVVHEHFSNTTGEPTVLMRRQNSLFSIAFEERLDSLIELGASPSHLLDALLDTAVILL